MNGKPRVLLTASYGPNTIGWGEDMYDLLKSRLARGHGPFSMSSHMHYFALYLIAENLSCPTTVLENPHWDEFDLELDEGYDYVGIQLKSLHTAKVARMVKRIREKCPDTKIVIGGYGVMPIYHPVPGDVNGDADYIRENAHYLCREEGVQFMRRLLDDTPIDREITQYHLPMCSMSINALNAGVRNGIILVSLGCPNACDFCTTSAFFYHKKFYVAEPEQVYRFIKNYQKRVKANDIVVVLFDEDIFLNADYVRELGRLLRSDKSTWGVQWFSFGSIRSLSQFTGEELRDCGVGSVWIGVESFMTGDKLCDDCYEKRRGLEVKKVFEDLHRNGINTTASLVLGFDFHTPENLKEDIDQFVALKPLFYQIAPLTPCPGTAFYERMLEENRILDTFSWEDGIICKDDLFKLKNFKLGEIKEYFDYAHDQIRDNLGPPTLQLLENMLNVYSSLKDSSNEMHAYKANRTKFGASGLYAVLRSIKQHHHSPKVRERALTLERRYREEIGNPPLPASVASYYVSNKIRKKTRQAPEEVVSDPPPRWTYYNTNGPGDRVYVRKGRKAKKAKPYKNRRIFTLIN